MTDIIDVRNVFSYILTTSSINYVRNYNFNSATVTDIRLLLINSGSAYPITVNVSASVPWIRIKNSTNNADITFPTGNIVLPPSSSTVTLVQVDLPTEIENVIDTAVYPDLYIKVVSGSYPIVASTVTPTVNNIAVSSDIVRVYVDEQSELITVGVYDTSGQLEISPFITWESADTSIADIDERKVGDTTQYDIVTNTERYIRGVSVGETTVTVTSGTKTATIRVIVSEKSMDAGGGNESGGGNGSGGGGSEVLENPK